jgi:hypothetical protein
LQVESERAALVLGKAFRLVPHFTVANVAALSESLASNGTLLDGDSLAPFTWIQQMALVRAGARRLNDVFTLAQCFASEEVAELRVAQLPPHPAARWVALPQRADNSPPDAALSLVLSLPQAFAASLPATLSGLMVDEWVEVVPGRTEQTAITFQFNAPASRPPQSILLAIPPGDRPAWDIEALESIIRETLDLARLRLVEPASLDDEVSYFLPALYFGLNLAGDTVTTDFRRAAATAEN